MGMSREIRSAIVNLPLRVEAGRRIAMIEMRFLRLTICERRMAMRQSKPRPLGWTTIMCVQQCQARASQNLGSRPKSPLADDPSTGGPLIRIVMGGGLDGVSTAIARSPQRTNLARLVPTTRRRMAPLPNPPNLQSLLLAIESATSFWSVHSNSCGLGIMNK
jgi:hypothetical protein